MGRMRERNKDRECREKRIEEGGRYEKRENEIAREERERERGEGER